MDITQPLDHGVADGLQITASSRVYLSETAKWAKFLAIVGFILVGFMVIGAIGISVALETFTGFLGSALPFPSIFLTVIYLLLALLYFLPVLYMYKYANSFGS